MWRIARRGVLILLLTTGCASIVNSTTQTIPINSTPPGAEFEVFDEQGTHIVWGTTPGQVTLRKSDGYFEPKTYRIEVTHEDRTQTVMLEPSVSAWYSLGNLIGLVGYLVFDPHNGSMYVYDQGFVNIKLQ